MATPDNHLLSQRMADLLPKLKAAPEDASLWSQASSAFSRAEANDEDLELAIEAQDIELFGEVIEGWQSGDRVLPEGDRLILKRAIKSFRKRLKLTMLDDSSGLGGGPMSGGRGTDIVGVTPPEHYPAEVWAALVRQGRLVADRWGTFELPKEG